jgi:octaprenyl-diphosphate synthase
LTHGARPGYPAGFAPTRRADLPTLSAPPSLDSALSFLQDDLRQVERTLLDGTASIASLIPEVAEYTLGGGGKRIRPVLVLLGARLFGYAGPRAIQIAAAAEWLHSASLLHDDVVDGAQTRRGRASAAAVYGARQAVLVGDFLYAILCRTIVEDGNRAILQRFAETIGHMAEGEVLQLSRSFSADLDEATALEVIGRKTSSLLATSVESGAILGGAKPDEQRALRDYGWQLGLAFQLVDDALDYTGTSAELGKQPLTDLAEGKVTLPLLLTLKDCAPAERAALSAELAGFSRAAAAGTPPQPADLARVAEAVERHGGAARTLARARALVDDAISRLAPFDDGAPRHALAVLARFVVARRS